MTSNASTAIDVVEVDSQSAPAPTDASLAPLEPPSSHLSSSSRHRQSRKREMDNGDNTQVDGSFGQFSFAPATQTTVVTTTTTTTTTFPPLIIKPPRATRNLDTKLYPLAASPTPNSLRNIKFELGGKSVVFNEPEDTLSAVNEVCCIIHTMNATPFFFFFWKWLPCHFTMTDAFYRREKGMTRSKPRMAYSGLWHPSPRLMIQDILDAMPTPGYLATRRVTRQV